jgi:hypothetical protein
MPITEHPPQSDRIEARTGLRMMPTSPRSPLSFRTAGVPQYGWKDGVSDGAFPTRRSVQAWLPLRRCDARAAPGARCNEPSICLSRNCGFVTGPLSDSPGPHIPPRLRARRPCSPRIFPFDGREPFPRRELLEKVTSLLGVFRGKDGFQEFRNLVVVRLQRFQYRHDTSTVNNSIVPRRAKRQVIWHHDAADSGMGDRSQHSMAASARLCPHTSQRGGCQTS